ncbi:MAG: insulinase family protein [Burkholderiales bacterium]|nr:insulinase family protein [Burkholderiales bacterium]
MPLLDRRQLVASLAGATLSSLSSRGAHAAAPLVVPPLPLRQRRLANGLQVISLRAGGVGTVAINVWYRVGGKDDPEGRSGFAHLFEHLLFKGSAHLLPEQFDRLTEDVGGENNAFTAEDVTAYHAVVPSHHLERILWAEADRMASLRLDEGNFRSERSVVQEEFRQRVLAEPYGRLFNAIPAATYQRHPYRRPVIGSIEDLDAATLDDVRRFHATYYRPDNAVLIVAGDFDPAQLDAWVDRYFAPIARPQTPVPRVTITEAAWRSSRRIAVSGPSVPLPAVVAIWQGPRAGHPDVAPLSVAQALLSSGESSRLNQSLVYRQRIAQAAAFQADPHTDAGALFAYAIAAGRSTPQQLLPPLLAELRRLAQAPIAAAELDKVKTQMLTAALGARQSAQGLAEAIGWAVIHRNDPEAINRELAELQAVSAADVQRVLRQYVLGRPSTVLHYTQERRASRPRTPTRQESR